MRKLLVFAFAALLLVSSCTRKTDEHPCAAVLCTAIFAAVDVQVTDANNQPVALDEVYTERVPTGERITYLQFPATGRYTILDDSYRSKLYNAKGDFRLFGKKNGVVVVDELYTISADCCHVKKESGKDSVRVN